MRSSLQTLNRFSFSLTLIYISRWLKDFFFLILEIYCRDSIKKLRGVETSLQVIVLLKLLSDDHYFIVM